jgi:mannose-6-phosphate isomerase
MAATDVTAPPLTAPLRFTPVLMERVWGGRRLARLLDRTLPPNASIGESWELSDRVEGQSVVSGGPLAGTTLHELWSQRRQEIFGARAAALQSERFPLLIKLLDAEQTLSVQVHPAAEAAAALGGEPKYETWFVLDAAPRAHVYLGLRAGVTRERFEHDLRGGRDISALLHRVAVRRGDVIAVPGGRIHAIGAGCVIVEVQQNSNTTYRAYDFGRTGLGGDLRELHVEQALSSINWDDIEPTPRPPAANGEPLVDNDCFELAHWRLDTPHVGAPAGECSAISVLSGNVSCGDAHYGAGDLFLLPATLRERIVEGDGEGAEVLQVMLPRPAATA